MLVCVCERKTEIAANNNTVGDACSLGKSKKICDIFQGVQKRKACSALNLITIPKYSSSIKSMEFA